ncbi:MAG: hypothetical protein KDC53_23235, partial [Saprospiraceae bacterium]|nr:hypothetical protein [Saprospiraceae bacterium]
CLDESAYLPDTNHLDNTPIKYIRVNFHFMNAEDSTKNYNGARAKRFARQLIEAATGGLEKNTKMLLPQNNQTPVLPVRYRYQIATSRGYEQDSGIYCHYDDRLYWFVSRGKNRNNYDRDVLQTYGIGMDSIINLFIMPHHPDSVLSESYSVTSAGIALGAGVKLSGIFETRKEAWAFRGLINHEIGHVLGLRHTWNTNDGCDDTPKNPNCWNVDLPPPCDTAASNNLMDYNASQSAWSPCQIGKIQMAMAKENSLVRKMLIPNWCHLDPNKTIIITDTIQWRGAKDLEGNLVIGPGGVLEVFCRLSMPPGSEIQVQEGGKLVLHSARLHNACGMDWKGITVSQRKTNPGTVVYAGDTRIENVPSSSEMQE